MLPVIAPLIVIFTLAWFQHTLDNGFFFRKKQIIKSCLVFAVIVNMILLAPLTVNYAKKGLVEPLVKIEQVKQGASIIFITPEKKRIFPEYYAGLKPVTKYTARKWSDIPVIKKLIPAPDFFILYPPQDHDLSRYVDSVSASFGEIVEYDHIGSSTLDYILHELNPRHNPTNEAWIYVQDKEK